MTAPVLANLEMEQTLLGAVLSLPQTARDATFLKPSDFAYEPHGTIWTEIQRRFDTGETISLVGVSQSLGEDLRDYGGTKFLVGLTKMVFAAPYVEAWAQELKSLSLRRSAIQIMADATEKLNDLTGEANAEEQIADTLVMLERATREGTLRMQTDREIREDEVSALSRPVLCYSTGFHCLDDTMGGGIMRRKAYAFAGRMKSGKTLLASQISHALNRQNVRHAYFACEMGAGQIEHRAMATELGVNSLYFLDNRTRQNPGFIARAGSVATQSKGNILYRDAPGLTFDQLRRDVTHAILGRGAEGFIVDYLQLVGGKRKGITQAEHLDELSQWIAEVCYKRNVFAIVLCQLNQEGNVRGGEGIKLAFDQVYELRRSLGGEGPDAWLEMMATRYTKWQDAGSEISPAFLLDTKIGPRFVECGAAAEAAE